MERRFIIWKQTKGTALQPLQHNSEPLLQPQPQSQAQQRPSSRFEALFEAIEWEKEIIPTVPAPGAGAMNERTHNSPGVGCANLQEQQQQQCRLPRWGQGLKNIWKVFSDRLGNKTYGNVDLRTTDTNVSCALNVGLVPFFFLLKTFQVPPCLERTIHDY